MRLDRILTLDSEEANITPGGNTPNVLTPILEFLVPSDITYFIEPDERYPLFPLKTKLFDGGGAQLPASSLIVIGVQFPNMRFPEWRHEINYGGFVNIDERDMENERYRDKVLHPFPLHPETGQQRYYRLRSRYRLVFGLISPVVVDLSNSYLETRVIQRPAE